MDREPPRRQRRCSGPVTGTRSRTEDLDRINNGGRMTEVRGRKEDANQPQNPARSQEGYLRASPKGRSALRLQGAFCFVASSHCSMKLSKVLICRMNQNFRPVQFCMPQTCKSAQFAGFSFAPRRCSRFEIYRDIDQLSNPGLGRPADKSLFRDGILIALRLFTKPPSSNSTERFHIKNKNKEGEFNFQMMAPKSSGKMGQ